MEKFKEYLPFIVLLVVVLLLKSFVVTTIRVNGESMYPTLMDKDIMLLDKISYRFKEIKRFDVVVINHGKSKWIKRVIGLPGEVVEYRDNKLFIDGEEVKDSYNSIDQEDFLVELDEDSYFVMGDNRGDSMDSRVIGPVSKSDVLGHADLVIFPFNRWGRAK